MSQSAMTSRERVLAAMRREPVDHVPFLAHYNPLSAPQRRGYRWQFPWGPSQREQCEYCVNQLGTDARVHVDIPRENPEPGVSSKAWVDDGVIHKVWTTPSGELSASLKYDERWPHGLDIPLRSDFLLGHSLMHWVENERDVACLKHIIRPPQDLDRVRFGYQEAKRLADRLQLPIMTSIGSGLTNGMHLIGSTEICLMAVEHPEVLHAWIDLEHGANLKCIEIAGDLGVDIVNRNGFYETADFYSPAMLEDFLGRPLRAEGRAIRAAGMVSTYTINTGIMPILEYLATLEFDNFFGIDIAFQDMDLVKVRDTLQEKSSFWIGPSSVYHIFKKGEDLARQAVRDCFEVFGKTGLILGPMVSVHSIMPWQNALAMIDEWKKLR